MLDLAIQGKLTEQLESDGTAEVILKTVNSKKDISQTDNIPFQIPDNWKWVKLCDLYIINPPVVAASDIDSAFIPMEKVSAGFEAEFSYDVQPWGLASKNHTKFQNDDVAFAKITPCFENRKSFIAKDLPNGIGGGTTELIILRQKEMYPQYTYLLVVDQRFITAGSSSYKGVVGQQRVKSDVVKNYYVPVPPLAEQKRIVERVEEIFKLLDIIDEAQAKYSADAETLKSKLITMGIQGKLTEQLESDGTAEELFAQIQEEKQRLIKEGKIKKEKPLPPVADEEIPFEIPRGWKWVRFANIVNFHLGKTPARGDSSYWNNGLYNWITISDMPNSGHISTTNEKISQKAVDDCFNCGITKASSLIMSFKLSIGKVAILDFDAYHNEAIITITPYIDKHFVFRDFLFLILPFVSQITESHGAIKGETLNKTSLSNMVLPLPPLAEQKRIADKLDEILRVIG